MKFNFKSILLDVVCVALFVVIAIAYFSPALDGRRLEQHDSGANDGINVETNLYRDSHGGETPRWNTSLFCGMPTYQIAPSYDSAKTLTAVENAYHLWLPDYVWYIFASMLGFYILLRAFDFRQWMAALGALVWAFSSYFFIIIAAGHIWKVMTLAYIPPTIAGMVLCYKGIWKKNEDDGQKTPQWRTVLLGTAVTALFAGLQIQANHIQMTYYFMIVEIAMFVAFLITAIGKKKLKDFFLATVGMFVAAVIAVALNASSLYHTYEYSNESMRGKSELVKPGDKADNQTDSGLERDYITAWSYGGDECFTFLIPNVKGGASSPLSASETAMKKADSEMNQYGIYNYFSQYWGEQPGTSGPVYVGAIVFMMFILGLILIPNKNPLKWGLVAATILSILLGMGHNLMPLTDFFIDHVPMYSKFRTVASILVVMEFTVPLIALWGLKLFVENPRMRALTWATCITVFICLFFIIIPNFGSDCLCTNDRNTIAQLAQMGLSEGQCVRLTESLSNMRAAMVSADAWRSIVYVLLGFFAFVWFCSAAKKRVGQVTTMNSVILCSVLFVLCLIDMWSVNKRYINDEMFVQPQGVARIQKTPADEYILSKSGTGRDYRVLNFTESTFNSNNTSAFYSSIGGYHAAKMRRYQEVIEAYISSEMAKVVEVARSAKLDTLSMMEQNTPYPIYDLTDVNTDSLYPVLNMLNARWFILAGGEGAKIPVENTQAFGNAWFAIDIIWANNANEELDALGKTALRKTAVINKADFSFLKAGGDGEVKLTSYGATEARYEVNSAKGGLVVFSEVYYPGWTATVDGTEVQIGRANYILRAINVPAGKHEVVFTFDPQTVHTTETIAYIALILLAILLVGSIAVFIDKKNKE